MATMIALVGEQPLPNFFPVHHYHPQEILFVYTTKTLHYYHHLRDILQSHTKVHELDVHPYNIPAITAKLRTKLDELGLTSSSSLIFNLTGGTKPMMIAAYQVAHTLSAPAIYLQSEGRQTRVFHYTWKDQELNIENEGLVPECICLADVFNLHCGPGQWVREKPKKDDGGNFEQAVAGVLRKRGYEIMTNVKTMNKQVDIDVAVRLGNQYGVVEAKLGKAGTDFKAIQQLITSWKSIGTYMQKFHVITVDQTKQQKMMTDMLGIEVISLPSYDKSTRAFSTDDQQLLLTRIEKALKG